MAQSNLDVSNNALYKVGAQKIVALSDNTKEAKICNDRVDPCKKAVLRLHPWNFATKRKLLNPTWTNIDNAANNGAGLVRVTATAHPFVTDDAITIDGVSGVSINSTWIITKIDANNFDLQDSSFSGTYVSTTTDRCTLAATFDYSYSIALPTDLLRVLRINDLDAAPQWRIERRRVVTNEYPLSLEYLYDVTDYTEMDALFYECLALYLAWDICDHLTQSASKKRGLYTDLFGGDGKVGILPKGRFVDATENSVEQLQATDWTGSRFNSAAATVRDPQT